jgi:hypothetical protein
LLNPEDFNDTLDGNEVVQAAIVLLNISHADNTVHNILDGTFDNAKQALPAMLLNPGHVNDALKEIKEASNAATTLLTPEVSRAATLLRFDGGYPSTRSMFEPSRIPAFYFDCLKLWDTRDPLEEVKESYLKFLDDAPKRWSSFVTSTLSQERLCKKERHGCGP